MVTPDGVSVAVQDWAAPRDAGGRPDVVLLHGFSQSHQSWLHQVSGDLAREFRLVTYDLRGHGASDKPEDKLFYQDGRRWADELQTVIEHTGMQRPVVVAWSYAGRIALDFLSLYGDESLSGLAMVDATSSTDAQVMGPAAPLLRLMCDPDPEINVRATREFLGACVARPLPPEEMEFMLEYNLAVPARIRANLRRPPARYDAVLRGLRLPTLVLHGALDPVNLPGMAAYTAGLVRDSELLIYDDVAHTPFWEAPGRFDADLADFVRRATGWRS